MQINSYQQIQSFPATQAINVENKVDSVTANPTKNEASVQVSISAQAQQLAQQDTQFRQSANAQPSQPIEASPENLPSQPATPLTGEKLEQAVQIKKAQLHYKAQADMVNIMTGNNQGLSTAGAYHLSQSEDARSAALEANAQQQSINNMQTYQEKTNAMNEQYSA